MWFTQYGQLLGPWFHHGDNTPTMAGIMALHDRSSSLLVTGDVNNGRLHVADR